MGDPNSIHERTEHLRREIGRLTAERNDALEYATFVGITDHQTREYRERCQKINRLMQELEKVHKGGDAD